MKKKEPKNPYDVALALSIIALCVVCFSLVFNIAVLISKFF